MSEWMTAYSPPVCQKNTFSPEQNVWHFEDEIYQNILEQDLFLLKFHISLYNCQKCMLR